MNFRRAFKELYQDAKEKYDIKQAPKLILRQDEKNANMLFGITNRHPKDILRSYTHELIHHVQNERGDLKLGDASNPKYAQDDDHLRKMEMEAYLKGNLLLRDFEDNFKYE